jgi:phosphatidylglycerol lysyltransferase
MSDRLRNALLALIGFTVFLAALEVLRTELGSMSWHEVTADVLAVPAPRLALAVAFTALNYALLTGYDLLAFASIRKPLSAWRIVPTSFLAYAISNSVGLSLLSGASIRYRFYTRWGVTAEELSRLVFAYVITFWLGLLLLGGLSFAVGPLPRELGLPLGGLIRPIGFGVMLVSLGYVLAAAVRSAPILVGHVVVPLPPFRIAAAQLVVSTIEWALAAAVLYVLVPPSGSGFLAFAGAFLAAQLLALASHVPGGVGVFEGVMMLLLKPVVAGAVLLPALIVYRIVYYLIPLTVALLALVADEMRLRRGAAATLGRLTERVAPRLVAVFTFLAGVVLLFSGATPAAEGRLALLNRVLPLGVIEASHFLGSIVGAALLLLSQALARRLDAAFVLTTIAIATGIVTSLLKGADFEEAAFLGLTLIVLFRARRAFDRRASLFDTRFSPGWIVAIAGAMGASVWLGMFAFKHVEYSHELWWQFELRGEASRMVRASVGAAVTLLLFALGRLLGHAPHEAAEPSDADLDAAGAIIARQTATSPNLVFLRDKALLFNQDRSAFVMYAVQGRSWVALGDPVGPPAAHEHLIVQFLERCDDFGGVPVFYEISKDHLHQYADVGLTFIKLGEEARVNLDTFAIDGSWAKKLRQALHRLDKEGASFRIIPVEEVAAVMNQLQTVSDDWLSQRAGAEKGFSLGFFRPDYLARFPIAVIAKGDRIVAFANLWRGAANAELSVDLMRFDRSAPRDVMDALFLSLMLWGKEQGYRWFSLGMAPLSGFESTPAAPLWNRLASFVYEHGEAVYNFRGLRAYKEKFNPVWQPRYLAYPGGLRLPRILADVSALVAGGYRRIFLK